MVKTNESLRERYPLDYVGSTRTRRNPDRGEAGQGRHIGLPKGFEHRNKVSEGTSVGTDQERLKSKFRV